MAPIEYAACFKQTHYIQGIIFCPLAREIGRGRVYNSRYDLPCVVEQTWRNLYDVRSQRRLTTFCLSQDTTVMYDIATCVPP